MDEEATGGKEISATQEGPKIHQGMSKVPLSISANSLKDGGISYEEVPGSNHMATLGPHDFTALCKGFKEEMNPHPHALLMSLIQPLRLGCGPLEDETNHDTSIENHETICEPKEETTTTPLEELAAMLTWVERRYYLHHIWVLMDPT